MTSNQFRHLHNQLVNIELLHLAIATLEKIRDGHIANDLPNRWIDEMKEEAHLLVTEHDQTLKKFGVKKSSKCSDCKGTGVVKRAGSPPDYVTCPKCSGLGF